MRKFAAFLVTASVLCLTPAPSYADDDVKSVIGGVIGALMVEGVKEMSKSQQQPDTQTQQEQIQWNTQTAPLQNSRDSTDPELQRNRDIQAALTKIGFYSGTVDGILGEGTRSAIQSWEKEFDQTVDGILTDSELSLLKSASKGGFADFSNYKDALSAGFDTKKEYSAFLKSGSSTKRGFDETSSAELTTKTEIDSERVKSAKNLISDMELFLPTYTGDIDLSAITKTLKELKPVTQGHWNDKLQEYVDDLRSYAETLSGFSDFHKQKENERSIATENRKRKIISDVESVRKFSDQFLRQNLTDTRAVELVDSLKSLPVTDTSMSENQLSSILNSAERFLEKNRLSKEFSNWYRSTNNTHVSNFSSANDINIEDTKNLIADIEAFLPAYAGDVDLTIITKSLRNLKGISSGQWNESMNEAVYDLRSTAKRLDGFPAFQKRREQERRIEAENKKIMMIYEVKSIKDFSNQFLREHLTDERAANLVDSLKSIPDGNINMNADELSSILQSAKSKIDNNKLSREFYYWYSDRQSENEINSEVGLIELDPNSMYLKKRRIMEESMWDKIKSPTQAPDCKSSHAKSAVKSLFSQNEISVPQSLESINEISYDESYDTRKCSGISRKDGAIAHIIYTFSRYGKTPLEGYYIEAEATSDSKYSW